MPEEMTINQIAQIGVEALATPGVSPGGGSNKQLTALKIQIDPDFAHTEYAAMGNRFDSISVPTMEKSKLTLSGPNTYTESVYLFSGLFGDATITTPAGGVNARKWVWSPLLSGAIAGRTFQVQQGSSSRARQVNYGRITDVTLTSSRKDSTIAGAGYAQQIQDGITLTASPTAIPLVPVKPKHWNVYLDNLAANIGTTKLLRCFTHVFGYAGAYGDIWPMDRAQASFATDVNLKPGLSVNLSVMSDATIANWWTQARAGQKYYIRFESISDQLIDNYQTLSITGTPTGGTFTLTYKGQTTAGIAYNAVASAVQSALAALSTIGTGNVTCAGGPLPASPVTITFTGVLANDTALLTHADSFTGGTSPAAALVPATVPYSEIIDVCAVPAPDAFKDDAGAWTQDFKFSVVSDPLWTVGNPSGTAVIATVVNGQTAL